MKTCSACNIEKPLDEFYYRKDSKDKRTARCKVCEVKKQREYKLKKNPDYKPKSAQEKIDTKFQNEEELKNELLTILGYDLAGELSVYEQFLIKHNLVD
jgi:hypothetical protein